MFNWLVLHYPNMVTFWLKVAFIIWLALNVFLQSCHLRCVVGCFFNFTCFHKQFFNHMFPQFYVFPIFTGISFRHSRNSPGVFRAMDRAAISQQSLSTLLLLLLWIIQELCNRFRVPLGDNPRPAQVQPPPAPVGAHPIGHRCAHQCDHCASLCGRTKDGHRHHSCWAHRHLRWWTILMTGQLLMVVNQNLCRSCKPFLKIKPNLCQLLSIDLQLTDLAVHGRTVQSLGISLDVQHPI